jgi:hypothetical protein
MVQGGLTALEVEREHQLILYFSLPWPHSNFVPKVSCVEDLALILRSKYLQVIGFVCTSILHLCNSDVTPLRSGWLISSVSKREDAFSVDCRESGFFRGGYLMLWSGCPKCSANLPLSLRNVSSYQTAFLFGHVSENFGRK